MEYNTTREAMFIPEYGRNMQRMIQYICTIEDREKKAMQLLFTKYMMTLMLF